MNESKLNKGVYVAMHPHHKVFFSAPLVDIIPHRIYQLLRCLFMAMCLCGTRVSVLVYYV